MDPYMHYNKINIRSIHVFRVSNTKHKILQNCYELDLSTGQWSQGPTLLDARRGAASAQLGNGDYWVLSSIVSEGAATSEILSDGAFVRGTYTCIKVAECYLKKTDCLHMYKRL